MVKKRKLEEEEANETIEIEFALYEPHEEDYHSIRPFLVKAWEFSKETIVDASECANVISEQANIGNVIKTPDDDANSFGIVSLINLKQYQKELDRTIPALVAYLKKKCKKHCEHMPQLKEILSLTKNVGWLINERLETLPCELIPKIQDNLCEDIKWSQTTPECDKDEQEFYFFDTVIGLCTAFKDGDELVYSKFEEEAYVRHSSFNFAFPVRDTEHRVFFALDFAKLPNVVADIHKDALTENAAGVPLRGEDEDDEPMRKKKRKTEVVSAENRINLPMKKKKKKKN